jgi:hypothetical protein
MKTLTIVPSLLASGLLGTALAATVNVLPSRQTTPPGPTAPAVASLPGKRPQIHFPEKTFDFGKVPAGKEIQHDFEFVNTGDEVLEIRSVRTSCGCTTAADYAKQIAPGAKGRIPVILRTSGFTGPLHKTITVTSTAAREPTVVLQLKGEAWVPVSISPSYLYFPQVTGGHPPSPKTARITSNVETPLHILSTEVEPGAFTASLRTVEEGKIYEVEVTPTGDFKPGATQGLVRLQTNQKDTPELQVKIFLNVVAAVVALPKHLVLPSGNLPAATKRYVSIRVNDGNPLNITRAEVPGHPEISVSVTETVKDRMFRVEAVFPAGLKLQQDESPVLLVTTTRSDFKQLEIPIIQPARPATVRRPPATTAIRPASVGPVTPDPETHPVTVIPSSPVPELKPIPPRAGDAPSPPLPPVPPRSR